MKARDAEALVLGLLRRILKGSDREIAPDRPLGPGGAGLDSLGIVEFVVALENESGVAVPDAVWDDVSALTPRMFIDLLTAGR